MRKVEYPRSMWWNVVFFFTALVVVVADQLSKMWIRSYPEKQLIFKAGFFRVIHTQNTGAAFGLFQGQSFPLTVVAFIGIVAILLFTLFFYHRFSLLDGKLGKPVLGLILGGTIGNLIDRLSLRHVTDFIDIGVWPSFNIADSAITVGVILFAYSILFLARAQTTDLSD
ncbi:signal peptidase II [Chloroflexota bacterium]